MTTSARSGRCFAVALACGLACAAPDPAVTSSSTGAGSSTAPVTDDSGAVTSAGEDSSAAADDGTSDAADASTTGMPCEPVQDARWIEHPTSHFGDLGHPDISGASPGGVINAWSSAVLDPREGRLVVFGGGHGDAANNGVYAFGFADAAWSTMLPYLEPPPGWPPTECIEAWPLDPLTPVSRHTYGNIVYVPASGERPNDAMFLHGGSMACGSGGFGSHTWFLDLSTLVWEDLGALDDGPGGVQMRCEYSAADDRVFCSHGDIGNWFRFRTFDPSARTWSVLLGDGPAMSVDQFGSALVESEGSVLHRRHVLVGGTADTIWTVDLDSGTLAEHATIGGAAITASGRPGIAWDERRLRLVAYNGRSADVDPSTVWELDPEAMAWTEVALTGGPARNEGSTGMFGRWRYVPDSGSFVVVNAADQNVFEYLPAGACR